MWITLAIAAIAGILLYSIICYGFSRPQQQQSFNFEVSKFVSQLPDCIKNNFDCEAICAEDLRELGKQNGFILELDWRGTFSLMELSDFVRKQYNFILPYETTQQFIDANSTSPGNCGNYTINLLRCFDQDLALANLRILLWETNSSNYFISILQSDDSMNWIKKHPEYFHGVQQLKL